MTITGRNNYTVELIKGVMYVTYNIIFVQFRGNNPTLIDRFQGRLLQIRQYFTEPLCLKFVSGT